MADSSHSPDHLSFEAIIDEFAQRIRRGERLTAEECAKEHPDHADQIRRLFPALLELERAFHSLSSHSRPADAGPTLAFGAPARGEGSDATTLPTFHDAPRRLPAAGADFGDYALLEKIAQGGMGAVYKARQKSLDRIVALKLVLESHLDEEEADRRFEAEARAAARLDHPGIVPVYEFGRYEGRRFLAMGLIEGESLAARLARGPMPARQAAETVKRIAEAIGYAHSHGVAHRDLKPQNVLMTSDDVPKVTDFGLAKDLLQSQSLTMTGQILGTPSYMAPEQAAAGESGKAADIYAIGAMLYCLLTGRPPFQGANVIETLRQVRDDDPAPPRLLNSSIPLDLQTICLKCLQKQPADRYGSAEELAGDLGMFLSGDRVLARPPSALYLAQVWLRKHLRTAAAAALVGLIFGVLFGVSSLGMVERGSIDRVTAMYAAQLDLGSPPFPFNLLIWLNDSGFVVPLAFLSLGLIFAGLPSLGIVIRFFARPADLQSDAAAGALAGLVAGAAAFVCGIGWTSYHSASIDPLVQAADELRALPEDANVPGVDSSSASARAAEMLEHLAERHPELRDVPPESRAQVFIQQSALRGSVTAFWRTVRTMLLLLFGFPAVITLQTVFLGQLERRAQALLSAKGGAHPRVREIVERKAPVKRRGGQLVAGPYFLISYAAAGLILAPLFMSGVGNPQIASTQSALGNVFCLLVLPLIAIGLAANVLRRSMSARRVYHAHVALLDEHVESLDQTAWFPVVCSLPDHEAGEEFADSVGPGLLFVGDKEVRFAGRSLSGTSIDRRFTPDRASVQARSGWRQKANSVFTRDNKRAFWAPGWLLFTIDDQGERWSQYAFYGLPLLIFDRLNEVVVRLKPPLDGNLSDIVNDQDLPGKVGGELFAMPVLATWKDVGHAFTRPHIARPCDCLTADAYRAVQRVLPTTEPVETQVEPPTEAGPSPVPLASVADDAPLAPERAISPGVRKSMRILRAVPFVFLAITIGAPIATIILGAVSGESRPPPSHGFALVRDGEGWSRFELPEGWKAVIPKNPKDRYWGIVDAAGRPQFLIRKHPYFVQWDAAQRQASPHSYESFVREATMRGDKVTQHDGPRGRVAEVVGDVREHDWLTDGDGDREYCDTRSIRYFGSFDGRPLAVSFDVRAADFDALAPVTWEITQSIAARSTEELTPTEQEQTKGRPKLQPPFDVKKAGLIGVAGAASCFGSFIVIILVQTLLIAGGRLFLEPIHSKRAERVRRLAAHRNKELADLGFAPDGHYTLQSFDRPAISFWTREGGDAICYRYDLNPGETWFFLSRLAGGNWLRSCNKNGQNTARPFVGFYSQSFDKLDVELLWKKHQEAYRWMLSQGARPSEAKCTSPRDWLAECQLAHAQYFRRRPWRLLFSIAFEFPRWLRVKDRSIQQQMESGMAPSPVRFD